MRLALLSLVGLLLFVWPFLGLGLPPDTLALTVAAAALVAFVFGALMDLSIWTPLQGAPALSWSPGMPAGQVVLHFGRFYLLTSLAYDGFRAAGNAVMVLLLGPAVLAALARLRSRFKFEVVPLEADLNSVS